MTRDDSMTAHAAMFLLRGQGEYQAEGLSAELGYSKVSVKPFGDSGADVWFYRADDPLC